MQRPILMVILPALACSSGPRPSVSRPMPAGVVVRGSIDRYSIEGASVQEITRSLREARQREGGFAGHYRARFRWTYNLSEAGIRAGCRVTNIRVELESLIRSPEWKQPSGAAEDLVKAWQTYSTALEDHERQHENIAIRAAGDLVQRLQRLTDLSCRQLRLDVQREGTAMSQAMQERQVALDDETRHGATTGARWPP
jgi:predicted secreted Zn-dependent protease